MVAIVCPGSRARGTVHCGTPRSPGARLAYGGPSCHHLCDLRPCPALATGQRLRVAAAPTLYYRHNYYGDHTNDWAYATKVDGQPEWCAARSHLAHGAHGSPIACDGHIVGSEPIGENLARPSPFRPRPTATVAVVCQAARGRVGADASPEPKNGGRLCEIGAAGHSLRCRRKLLHGGTDINAHSEEMRAIRVQEGV